MNEPLIHEAFFSRLNEEFSDEIIFYKAYQENTKEAKKYATLYIVSDGVLKSRKAYFDRENPKEKQSDLVGFTIQIDFHSDEDNLMSLVKRVKSFLKNDKTSFYLNKRNLYLKNISNVRSLPEETKKTWVYRKTIDLFVEAMVEHSFDVDYIKYEDIEGRVH